jgi:hypothetical protein
MPSASIRDEHLGEKNFYQKSSYSAARSLDEIFVLMSVLASFGDRKLGA